MLNWIDGSEVEEQDVKIEREREQGKEYVFDRSFLIFIIECKTREWTRKSIIYWLVLLVKITLLLFCVMANHIYMYAVKRKKLWENDYWFGLLSSSTDNIWSNKKLLSSLDMLQTRKI